MGPSGKQRKSQLQLKRAIKRGDAPIQSSVSSSSTLGKKVRRPPKPGHTIQARQASENASHAARKLQSAFVGLDREFLDETRRLAGVLTLRRPIPRHTRLLEVDWVNHPVDGALGRLCIPKRPKWRYEMSKAEVQSNEEACFRQWLAQQDAAVEQWRSTMNARASDSDQSLGASAFSRSASDDELDMPHPPTYFERNLEVWRQLWRVTEMSDILLLLLDSRCPSLHLPPSLAAYLSLPAAGNDTAPRKANVARVILVLTKVDISGPARVSAWTSCLETRYPGIPIVPVEAYAPKSSGVVAQGRVKYRPQMAGTFRERIVHTLKEVHAEMLQPPERVRNDEEKMRQWKPKVRKDVDWERVMIAKGAEVGKLVGGAADRRGEGGNEDDDRENIDLTSETASEGTLQSREEPEFLTVGLIGQPNVGKSSLLNALFETTKVRASRTPGKTKHFQTLFWTPDVRLVDCPGLVMPSLVPIDIQQRKVLIGVLPISQVSAIPFCVHQIAQRLPLEDILALKHPSVTVEPVEDKRTWRSGERPHVEEKSKDSLKWTANFVLTAHATKKGWITAKAGRPDVNRSGNAILRLVSQGTIPWAFWPPGYDIANDPDADTGDGIWLRDGTRQHEAEELELVEWEDEESENEHEHDGEGEESAGDIEEEEASIAVPRGRFDVLSID